MNVKEYISSGIVELYVLGIATAEERDEFETMCKLHPEVAQARQQFELMLETHLLQEAAAPPAGVKENIQSALTNTDATNATETPEKREAPVRRLSVWKITAAASVLLLAGAAFWIFSLNKKYGEAQRANADLRQRLNESTAKVTELEQTAQTLQASGMKMATMLGTANAPGSFANVYWDTTTKNTYLLINNMPKPASDKQYQLWALLDGQPIDLGVIDPTIWQKELLIEMKNVQNAQAFAITLEPRGGSQAPTMEAMYVMGRL